MNWTLCARKRSIIEAISAGLAVLAVVCGAAALSAQKPRYAVVDLGPSGPAGQPFHISNNGFISAAVGFPDGTDRSVIYFHGHTIDISSPGLGGANSMPFGINLWGQAAGAAETATPDPVGEDFCGFASLGLASAGNTCLPFVLQNGRMVALPTLSDNQGHNGVANAINDFGVVAGAAENTTVEPGCPSYDPSNLQFQQMQFKPVAWKQGKAMELPTIGSDAVGTALAINNAGEVAGTSGNCAVFNFQFLIPIHPVHAVFWEADGTATDLGSLGGTDQSLNGNIALGINKYSQVVGLASLADNVTFHGFVWSRQTGTMQDLGTAPGVANSSAIAINDQGVAVGVSVDATHFEATIWQNGVATDLNTLVPANSSLYLLIACSINSHGQIIGFAIGNDGQLHGYQLNPMG